MFIWSNWLCLSVTFIYQTEIGSEVLEDFISKQSELLLISIKQEIKTTEDRQKDLNPKDFSKIDFKKIYFHLISKDILEKSKMASGYARKDLRYLLR